MGFELSGFLLRGVRLRRLLLNSKSQGVLESILPGAESGPLRLILHLGVCSMELVQTNNGSYAVTPWDPQFSSFHPGVVRRLRNPHMDRVGAREARSQVAFLASGLWCVCVCACTSVCGGLGFRLGVHAWVLSIVLPKGLP